MRTPLPIVARYEGEGTFQALGRSKREADAEYVVGQVYRLDNIENRSTATHNHQFAWVAEAWRQLPEDLMDLYPSPEHLRKRALVQAGFYDETIIDAGTNAAALRVASEFRRRNDFSLVIVRGPAVVIRDPKSQSRRAMPAKEFQDSKTKIMDVIAEMIGVEPETLRREAGKAA
ncbi:MAG: hypothetical protein WC026_15645 [Hyphomicrobium sp.]|uniref:hypothetical protein n=1 Tax=Hyphomicrobium sp. TaxID=82 RepID=UPI0035676F7A